MVSMLYKQRKNVDKEVGSGIPHKQLVSIHSWWECTLVQVLSK